MLAPGRIRHTVAFTLRHEPGSEEETDFIVAAEELSAIPGVEAFELLRQVGKKNAFTYGISMEFRGPEAYEGYNAHPQHRAFVAERWEREVVDFLELDYAPR
jgi:hypothetical protein